MIPAPKEFANLRQGSICQLSAEIHGNLSWQGQTLIALTGIQIFNANLEVGNNYFSDYFQGYFLGSIIRENIFRDSATSSVVIRLPFKEA